MKKPSKTAAELEASIKVEMEDICDCLPILTISIQPDGDSWKVKVVQEGSVDDTDRREMVEQIAARLVESESTFDYFTATRAYLERYGKPVAFYSDKHGVFRVNRKDAIGGDGMTQFGRALHAPEHRHHLCQFVSGQGPGRAGQWNAAGPAGEGDAVIRHRYDCGRQRIPAGVHGAIQRPLCQGSLR